MAGACALAAVLEDAKDAFDLILQIGAGTGLIFILRWFWWRINALTEIVAMIVSFLVAIAFKVKFIYFVARFFGREKPFNPSQELILGVLITTIAWVVTAFVTRPTDKKKLRSFYRLVKPGGPGWQKVLDEARRDGDAIDVSGKKWDVPMGILCMVFGCFAVYGALFATGYWIYANYVPAVILTVVAVVSTIVLIKAWSKLNFE